jgi:filamentous hemagglutinin family protein
MLTRLARPTSFARIAPLLGAALLAAPPAYGQLPSGGTSDCAIMTYHDHQLIVSQRRPDCVIDWTSFSIDRGYEVMFMQFDSWRTLNRVNGEEFTRIAGTLTANGSIYIVNPAGIMIDGGTINVGALYAAAASMDDADFLAGVDRFTDPVGEVVNTGTITGDAIHLLGRRVANHGLITGTNGAVTMLAGAEEILIGEEGGHLLVRIDGVDLTDDLSVSPGGVRPDVTGTPGVENTGVIDATGGEVLLGVGDLYSLAVRNTGSIDAAGGSARLAAVSGTVQHGTGGDIRADEISMTGDVILLESDLGGDSVRFNDPVVVGADVRVEGVTAGTSASDVTFASTVDSAEGETNDLEVDADQTTFQDDVGVTDRLGALALRGRADVQGDIHTADGVTFDDDATFTGSGAQFVDAGAGPLTAHGSIVKSVGSGLTLRTTGAVATCPRPEARCG